MKKGDLFVTPDGKRLEFVNADGPERRAHLRKTYFVCREYVGVLGAADKGIVAYTAAQLRKLNLQKVAA